MDNNYIPVHQVWNFVTLKSKQPNIPLNSVESVKTPDKTRHVVQVTRIKRKIDIITLAQMVGTTPKAISAFEKGEDILSQEVLEALFRVLEIPTKRL
jgi:hypothetical protein